jgi:hypothetical protein
VGLSHRKAGRGLTKCLWVFMILLLLLVNRISGGKWRQERRAVSGEMCVWQSACLSI